MANGETYRSVLSEMDRQFGRLFDRIAGEPALRENTIILVCSDNGPEHGAGSAGGLRGTKATLYEGGIRSPLIVSGTQMMENDSRGGVNRESVFAAFDFVPSLVVLANADVPDGVELDGEDLHEVLLGKSKQSRKAPVAGDAPQTGSGGANRKPRRCPIGDARGDWKLLCDYDGSAPQLYNLKKDAGETDNLAASESQTVDRMTKSLLAWNQTMPPDRGAELGVERKK